MSYLVETQLVAGRADPSPLAAIESQHRSLVCITVWPVPSARTHEADDPAHTARGSDSLEHATWEDAEWR